MTDNWTDNFWIAIFILVLLILLDSTFWWFPGVALAFYVGRWSKS